MLSSLLWMCAFEKGTTQALGAVETLSRAPMTWVMNSSFNCDQCHPFSSNNGPVLQRDWDANYIMASDVLYIGKRQRTCCFHPSSVTSMQRSRAWELAFGIKPGAIDCGWPSGAAIPSCANRCIYSYCSKQSLVLFASQTWCTHTDTVCGLSNLKRQYEFVPSQNKQLSYYSPPALILWNGVWNLTRSLTLLPWSLFALSFSTSVAL